MTVQETVSVDGIERTRKDVFRELELILEAKKNINGIITAMYSVFLALEGFLLYGFFVLSTESARVSIAIFGAVALLGLAVVTVRTQGTNDRCDNRAHRLETVLGVQVMLNYRNVEASGWPKFLFRARMHDTLFWVDIALVAFWVVLAILALLGHL